MESGAQFPSEFFSKVSFLCHRLFAVTRRPVLFAPPDGLIWLTAPEKLSILLPRHGSIEEFVEKKISHQSRDNAQLTCTNLLHYCLSLSFYPPHHWGGPSLSFCFFHSILSTTCGVFFFIEISFFLNGTPVLCLTSHAHFFPPANIQGQDESRRNPPDCTFIMSVWQVPWRTGQLSAHESARAEGGWDRRGSHLLTGIIMQRWFRELEKIIEFTSGEEDEHFNQNSSAQVGVIEFARKGLAWATFSAWQIIASCHVWHFAVPFRAHPRFCGGAKTWRLDTQIPPPPPKKVRAPSRLRLRNIF